MISTILTSLNIFTALLLLTMAALVLVSDPRSRRSWAIALLIFSYSLGNMALGFQLNAYSFDQVSVWILVELFATFVVSPAALLITLIILRPELSRRGYLSIPLWIFILTPVVFVFLDISNVSQQIFGSTAILDFESILSLIHI